MFLTRIWIEVYSVYGFSGCPEGDWMSLTLAQRAAVSSGIQPPPLVTRCQCCSILPLSYCTHTPPACLPLLRNGSGCGWLGPFFLFKLSFSPLFPWPFLCTGLGYSFMEWQQYICVSIFLIGRIPLSFSNIIYDIPPGWFHQTEVIWLTAISFHGPSTLDPCTFNKAWCLRKCNRRPPLSVVLQVCSGQLSPAVPPLASTRPSSSVTTTRRATWAKVTSFI